jgi:hypothetical protein
VRAFEEALDRPVTPADVAADRRRKERVTALLKGEIPT